MRRIDAGMLRGWITDGAELALLDAREEGEFGASHLFWAVPCPYSKRELRARFSCSPPFCSRLRMNLSPQQPKRSLPLWC